MAIRSESEIEVEQVRDALRDARLRVGASDALAGGAAVPAPNTIAPRVAWRSSCETVE